jgi:hypothetical protein
MTTIATEQWTGLKNGRVVGTYPSKGAAQLGIAQHQIDSASPARKPSTVNTVRLALTSYAVDAGLSRQYLGVNTTDRTDGTWFETVQATARISPLHVGDTVRIIAMGDNGAMGQGRIYQTEVSELCGHMAWLVTA